MIASHTFQFILTRLTIQSLWDWIIGVPSSDWTGRHGFNQTCKWCLMMFTCLNKMSPPEIEVIVCKILKTSLLVLEASRVALQIFVDTLASEKSVQYVAQCLASADSHCACARFCYSVSPWVTFQKFWNNNWIKICVDCYFNIFMLRRRILQRKRKSRRKLSAMCPRYWGTGKHATDKHSSASAATPGANVLECH